MLFLHFLAVVLIKVRLIKKNHEILAALSISHSTILATVKNGLKKIQFSAYNGARTVYIIQLKKLVTSDLFKPPLCISARLDECK